MKCNIVTEGETDVVVLRALLEPDLEPDRDPVRIVAGGGWLGAEALARSILTARREPVAVAVDADTLDPDEAAKRRQFLEWSLGQGGPREAWEVFLFEPCLEALLFRTQRLVEDIVGRSLQAEDLVRAEYDPRGVIDRLLAGRPYLPALQAALAHCPLEDLREDPVIRGIKVFVHAQLGAEAQVRAGGGVGPLTPPANTRPATARVDHIPSAKETP